MGYSWRGWVTVEEVDTKTIHITNSKRRQLIRNQILIHSKLLKSKIPSKELVTFQKNKHQISTEQLLENLKTIILANFSENIPNKVTEMNERARNCVHTNKTRTKMKAKKNRKQNNKTETVKNISLQQNRFYPVAYTDRWYPGLCSEVVDEQTAFFEFLHPSGKHFVWPRKKDRQRVHKTGVLVEISVEPVSNGRMFIIKDHQAIDVMFNG